jgi:hypothetical protein
MPLTEAEKDAARSADSFYTNHWGHVTSDGLRHY